MSLVTLYCILATLIFADKVYANDEDHYMPRAMKQIRLVTKSNNPLNLGECQGDCDKDNHCANGLICFQRNPNQSVPGCSGGSSDGSRSDYCIYTQQQDNNNKYENENLADVNLRAYGSSPHVSRLPLGRCEGDCDKDSDCRSGLICYQRGSNHAVPGCKGNDSSLTDYCIEMKGYIPGNYIPGRLTTSKLGLLLSEGLDARLIAESGDRVIYDQTSGQNSNDKSKDEFHFEPDAGATFQDRRSNNPGGWIYVSNSEVMERRGGVGAITFDKNGYILDYRRLLTHTSMNCGGGRTPWNTWVSCEEVNGTGNIYQVDPTGQKAPQKLTLGSDGGQFESFAYDDRDKNNPHFFVTEDHPRGALRRFTPNKPDWSNPWNMLHGSGEIEYLNLSPEGSGNEGTFRWTGDKEKARNNAESNYGHSEGIDVKGGQLLFVCKTTKRLFILDLDSNRYKRRSTRQGLFDGAPDQIERVLEGSTDLLYFTEEGGKDAGVHARKRDGSFYTILESPVYNDETSGLSFSPDGKFMYIAYQHNGKLFAVWRTDGLSFDESQAHLKSHVPSIERS